MNGNVLAAILLLGYLIAFCVYVFHDVNRLSEKQMEQDRLDELWFDGDPGAVTLEAVQTTARAE